MTAEVGDVTLVDGDHIAVQLVGGSAADAELLVSPTVDCRQRVTNDPWWLPADPAVLRGLARDLTGAADRMGH